MSTEAGATRRRGKEGFPANGSNEDLLDGMKVQCSMAKSRDCNVLLASGLLLHLHQFSFLHILIQALY